MSKKKYQITAILANSNLKAKKKKLLTKRLSYFKLLIFDILLQNVKICQSLRDNPYIT